MGDAYDDFEEERSTDDVDYREVESEKSCDNYGRDGNMSYDNYEAQGTERDGDVAYDNYEAQDVDSAYIDYEGEEGQDADDTKNKVVDESCLEGATFEQGGQRDDENTTMEMLQEKGDLVKHSDNSVRDNKNTDSEMGSLRDDTEGNFFALRNQYQYNEEETFQNEENVQDCNQL